MLMIRLQRVGRKNDPSFRVVVLDHRAAAKTGRVIEVVGSHDARFDRSELKAERINYWLSKGAKASNTVSNLLIKKGVSTGQTVDVSSKKLGKKATVKAKTQINAEKTPTDAEPTPTVAEEIPVEEIKEETLTEEIA